MSSVEQKFYYTNAAACGCTDGMCAREYDLPGIDAIECVS